MNQHRKRNQEKQEQYLGTRKAGSRTVSGPHLTWPDSTNWGGEGRSRNRLRSSRIMSRSRVEYLDSTSNTLCHLSPDHQDWKTAAAETAGCHLECQVKLLL